MQLVRCGHFPSCDSDGCHAIGSVIPKNPLNNLKQCSNRWWTISAVAELLFAMQFVMHKSLCLLLTVFCWSAWERNWS